MEVNKMKKILVLTLVLMMMFSATAFGALKVLPQELEAELTGIAIEGIATEKGVDVSKIEVIEGWVQEFHNIGREIFNVVVIIDKEQKASIAVDVETKELINEEGVKTLLEENAAKEPDEPVFRTMNLPTSNDQKSEAIDGDVNITSIPEDGEERDEKAEVQITGDLGSGEESSNPMKFAIPFMLVFAVGGLGFVTFKKKK